jgi:hypothetical protein
MNQWIYKWRKVLVFGVIICAVANKLDKEDDMIAIFYVDKLSNFI